MSERITVHATVRIEIELVESAWGDDCHLTQVYDQARRGALEKIQSGLRGARVIGEPVVTAVLVPEKR